MTLLPTPCLQETVQCHHPSPPLAAPRPPLILRGRWRQATAAVLGALPLAIGITASAHAAVHRPPAGAVKLPARSIKHVKGATCGKVKGAWRPGTVVSAHWFVTDAQQAKNYKAAARCARGGAKRADLAHARSSTPREPASVSACAPPLRVAARPSPRPVPPIRVLPRRHRRRRFASTCPARSDWRSAAPPLPPRRSSLLRQPRACPPLSRPRPAAPVCKRSKRTRSRPAPRRSPLGRSTAAPPVCRRCKLTGSSLRQSRPGRRRSAIS